MSVIQRNGRYLAHIRYRGVSFGLTFGAITAAKKWETRVKAAIDEGRWPDRDLLPPHLHVKFGLAPELPPDDGKPHSGWTLERALELFNNTVAVREKGFKEKSNRLKAWRRHPIAAERLESPDLPRDLQLHINARLKDGKSPNTIRNDVFALSSLFTHAARADVDGTGNHGWGIKGLHNPVSDVILPPQTPPRDRRLQDADEEEGSAGEEERVLLALAEGPDAAQMLALYRIAVCAGLRKSELLKFNHEEIRRAQGTTVIDKRTTKNGQPRQIVLSDDAIAALDHYIEQLPEARRTGKLFSLNRAAVHYRWRKAKMAAGVRNLKWHDLRHESLSRMAAAGLTLGELKSQSGHKSAQSLLGYLNAKPSDIARKLNAKKL
ncbi:tyrosine-type recombinase/integrase [Radicibacter daui]|uniref:tyrosine-type recombinase/integrase n=1 Tax=Radicibacter daui TaxID=3064829 RepID=UPI004046B6BC